MATDPAPIKDFELPEHSPRWARALGLRIDWQSKPTDRERIYHSKDRDVELVVGRRGNRWACEVSRYSEYTTVHIGCPWFAIHWRIAPGQEPPIGEVAVSWGAYIHDESIRGSNLVLDWGAHSKRIGLNPFRWDGYEKARLRSDGQWDSTPTYSEEGREIEWYSEGHPYAVTSLPHYQRYHNEAPRIEIETWEARATCYVDRTIRTRRWLPFWRWVAYHVYFALDDEVGRGKGSWKGGTMGFSEEMLPGDRVADVVGRAAAKGRGR